MTSKLPPFWQELKTLAKSFFYSKENNCILCDKPIGGEGFCPDCLEEYFYPESPRCLHCGKLIPKAQISCTDCQTGKGPKHLDKVVAFGYYGGLWRDFIRNVKYKGQPYQLAKISPLLGRYAIAHLPPPHYLIPVPLHPERLAERGFNQAEQIASLLQWECGIPLCNPLRRLENTPSQVGLGRHERLMNLDGTIHLSPKEGEKLRGARVWLIDDITTTGATLEHCAVELKNMGVKNVFGLVLAAGSEKGDKKDYPDEKKDDIIKSDRRESVTTI